LGALFTALAALSVVFAAVKLADALVAARAPDATFGAGGWVLLSATFATLAATAYGAFVRR
jgi:hypothetical protein